MDQKGGGERPQIHVSGMPPPLGRDLKRSGAKRYPSLEDAWSHAANKTLREKGGERGNERKVLKNFPGKGTTPL